jgi:hypothetical protein
MRFMILVKSSKACEAEIEIRQLLEADDVGPELARQ